MRLRFSSLGPWVRNYGDVALFTAGLFGKVLAFGIWFTYQTKTPLGAWMPWITLILLAVIVCLIQIGPRLMRRLTLFVLSVAISLLILGDVVQMRFTREVITVPAVMQASQLMDVRDAVLEYIYWPDLFYLVDVPLWLLLFLFLILTWRAPKPQPDPRRSALRQWLTRFALVPITLVLFGLSYSAAKATNREAFTVTFNNRPQVGTLGILGFHVHDLYVTALDKFWPRPIEDLEIEEIYDWYEQRPEQGRELVPFGVAKGKNIIFLQIESLQEFAVGLTLDGNPHSTNPTKIVTPNLNAFRKECVYFSHCFDQTHNGRSSDCDFLSFTSLHPVSGSGAVCYEYGRNDFGGFPGLLKDRGYSTFASCAFWENFWNMTRMHRNYGFRNHLYTPENAREHAKYVKYLVVDDVLPRTDDPEYQRNWLTDRSLLRQSLAEFKNLPRPFMAYTITIISHSPYDFIPKEEQELEMPAGLRRANPSAEEPKTARYLQHIRWVDRVIGEFFENLKKEGLYDDSVVIILGDHDGAIQDKEFRELGEAIGRDLNPYLMDRVPLFIKLPGGQYAGTRTTTCGQIDIAPTLCHIMGVPREGTFFMGHNLFRDNGNTVTAFRDGSFADQNHIFRNVGSSFESGECIDIRTGELLPDVAVCRPSFHEAIHRLVLSDKVLKYDLLPTLRQRWKERHPDR